MRTVRLCDYTVDSIRLPKGLDYLIVTMQDSPHKRLLTPSSLSLNVCNSTYARIVRMLVSLILKITAPTAYKSPYVTYWKQIREEFHYFSRPHLRALREYGLVVLWPSDLNPSIRTDINSYFHIPTSTTRQNPISRGFHHASSVSSENRDWVYKVWLHNSMRA